LMVNAMLGAVLDLLEVDKRRAAVQEEEILDRASRQLRLIALGMSQWRSKP
jgi:TetR/AcrR family transcriptional regulator, fatty acid biosynthesis regulator